MVQVGEECQVWVLSWLSLPSKIKGLVATRTLHSMKTELMTVIFGALKAASTEAGVLELIASIGGMIICVFSVVVGRLF